MDSYTFALALGGAGLVAMAAGGVSNLGGHAGHAGHSPSGATHGGAIGAPGAPGAPGTHGHTHHAGMAQPRSLAARRHDVAASGGVRSALLALASPRTFFSVLVGFGLTGVVGRHFSAGPVLLALALLGGLLFEMAIVGPLWNFLFRFASAPAASLEGSLMSEAHATSGFDPSGNGLVAVEVDGQLVQCLGILRPTDRALGIRVRAGDRLRVEEVDAARNRCTVSYVGRAIPE